MTVSSCYNHAFNLPMQEESNKTGYDNYSVESKQLPNDINNNTEKKGT